MKCGTYFVRGRAVPGNRSGEADPPTADAYNDSLGVTAAFNLNLLARMNRELDADFNLEQFEHVAKFNQDVGSVEMHIRSLKKQTVTIPAAALSVTFLEAETIWTESSHKYSLAEVSRIAEPGGFPLRCPMDR